MEVVERFGRSGTSEADLLDQAVLEGRLGRRPLLRDFQTWDATSDLAQATWEWPAWGDFKRFPDTRVRVRPYEGFERAARREVEAADRDWERRGKKEFARQAYSS